MIRRLAAVASAVLLASGCGQDMLFRNDHRFTIVTPRSHGTVGLPFTVRFTVRDPRPPRFGVFLDRAPQRPGRPLDTKDRTGITVTEATEVTFETVVRTDAIAERDRDRHEITVVALDERGVRMGESAGFVEFQVRR